MARRPKVSLIGAGTVGSVITHALHAKGYPIASIIARSGRRAIALAKAVGCERVSTNIADLAPSTQIVIIAVNDDAIAEVARNLAAARRTRVKGMFIFHLSGVHTSAMLEPVRKLGSVVASIHPIQTFPAGQKLSQSRSKLKGIAYGLEGNEDALSSARRIVADLGGRSIVIPRELKPLYHVACVFTSNYMMVFINAINDLAKRLGFGSTWTDVLGPLMATSMENAVAQPSGSMLTGPIVRMDLETLDLHMNALSALAPNLVPLYTVFGIELARIGKSNGRMTEDDFSRIIAVFKKSLKHIPQSKTKG